MRVLSLRIEYCHSLYLKAHQLGSERILFLFFGGFICQLQGLKVWSAVKEYFAQYLQIYLTFANKTTTIICDSNVVQKTKENISFLTTVNTVACLANVSCFYRMLQNLCSLTNKLRTDSFLQCKGYCPCLFPAS